MKYQLVFLSYAHSHNVTTSPPQIHVRDVRSLLRLSLHDQADQASLRHPVPAVQDGDDGERATRAGDTATIKHQPQPAGQGGQGI